MQAWKRGVGKRERTAHGSAVPAWYIEQCKANVEQHLREYESMLNAYEIWLQAWRARMAGFEGYDEPEMCKALDE